MVKMVEIPEQVKNSQESLMSLSVQWRQKLKEAFLVLFKVLDLPQGSLHSAQGIAPVVCDESSEEGQLACVQMQLESFLEDFDFAKPLLLTIDEALLIQFTVLQGQLHVHYLFPRDVYSQKDSESLDSLASKEHRCEAGTLFYDRENDLLSLQFSVELEKLDPFFLAIWLPLFIDAIAQKTDLLLFDQTSQGLRRMQPETSVKPASLKVQLQVLEEGEEESDES